MFFIPRDTRMDHAIAIRTHMESIEIVFLEDRVFSIFKGHVHADVTFGAVDCYLHVNLLKSISLDFT